VNSLLLKIGFGHKAYSYIIFLELMSEKGAWAKTERPDSQVGETGPEESARKDGCHVGSK